MPSARPDWTDEARQDLAAIIAYIAADNPAAADAFLDRIIDRTDSLPHHPHAFRKGRLPGTREMVLHPHYILVYAPRADGILILRLLHSARNWP
ncbi:type II toxin-antitoxin system mRNA interferase toxin, RelE/StbE family [Tabrizicola sp. TH137]|uniref:type II toxin-antitoxin system RelE/ParE family toxin n=1 Tax=Tabrizicola sp. TH137 TaxID=2067452 RepID=UPI000C7C3B8D|nr:type II toxin-antitoxin system RelE/ParE family toxin [Tabrizicola sp. TH137]PLL11013.1 type II toxin-antitoxin system mRNA interferase toxin, RelE/StbE family [Tabrizicola sp. TH137]